MYLDWFAYLFACNISVKLKDKAETRQYIVCAVYSVYLCQSHFAVNLHSDGCLRNDVQNTTQTTAGLSLDWKLTLGKQSIRPPAGHNIVENTQTKQQENTKWRDAATVVGNAPFCRHRQL